LAKRWDKPLTVSAHGQRAMPIPSAAAGYYRNSKVAFNTGHCLAAIFYLRTAIEQNMRKIIKPSGRISGEELAEEYQKGLPADFTGRFPSLKKIYQDLSGAMHEAREDDQLFLASLAALEKHFEARKVFSK
jgi:hypothetical protein